MYIKVLIDYIYKEEKHRWGATSRALIVDHLVLWSHFNRLLAVFFVCLFSFFLLITSSLYLLNVCVIISLFYYYFVQLLLLRCTLWVVTVHMLSSRRKRGRFYRFFWDFFLLFYCITSYLLSLYIRFILCFAIMLVTLRRQKPVKFYHIILALLALDTNHHEHACWGGNKFEAKTPIGGNEKVG